MARAIRVLAIMEAAFVSGPAKNLIEFAQCARAAEEGLPALEFTVVSYQRGAEDSPNPFVVAARSASIAVDIVYERTRFDLSVLAQLKAIVAARNPEIIQTHNVKSHFLMRVSGLWRTHCWIAFQHGYTATDFKMRCYNQLDRWSLRVPRHVVAVCSGHQPPEHRREQLIAFDELVDRVQPASEGLTSAGPLVDRRRRVGLDAMLPRLTAPGLPALVVGTYTGRPCRTRTATPGGRCTSCMPKT